MNTSMINSMASMNGLQQKLDILANNIANMNTAGYKRRDASFQDILNSYRSQHKDFQLPGRHTPLGMSDAWGAKISKVQLDLSQGPMQATENPLDLAIEGNALFEISLPRADENGNPVVDAGGELVLDRRWTRNGAFQLVTQPGDNQNGYLATSDGHLLRGTLNQLIAIPKNSTMVVDSSGGVFAQGGADNVPFQVAQLQLVRVLRPQLLENIGNNLYTIPEGTENIDAIVQRTVTPEAEGIAIRQGFIEQSNVNLANEMTELMAVQRAYQMNARAISSSDTMMNLANQLRG
jgi:flagellar basal-body rod protein FlgG